MDSSVFYGPSPWQLWGNTQVLELIPNPFTTPNVNDKPITLLRVAYGRPETWRFLFSARLVNAPDMGLGQQAQISVWFDLFTGIGRSAIRIPFWVGLETYRWENSPPPRNEVKWTNQASPTNRLISFTDETPQVTINAPSVTDTVIGQDMTVTANATFTTDLPLPPNAFLEVSGQVAPNTHVRPDWMRVDGAPGEQFTGGEVGGH